MTGVRALGDHILVKAVTRERVHPLGLVIPYPKDERPQEGEVLSVGEGIPWDLKPGDVILFGKYYADNIGARDLISIPRRHILGVLADKDDWKSVQPFNRIIVEMIPVIEDYKLMYGMKSDLVLVDKKFHFQPTFRRGKVIAMDETQSNDGDVAVGDIVYMRGDAGFTLDGDDSEDQPLHGLRHRWIKFKEVLAKFTSKEDTHG